MAVIKVLGNSLDQIIFLKTYWKGKTTMFTLLFICSIEAVLAQYKSNFHIYNYMKNLFFNDKPLHKNPICSLYFCVSICSYKERRTYLK